MKDQFCLVYVGAIWFIDTNFENIPYFWAIPRFEVSETTVLSFPEEFVFLRYALRFVKFQKKYIPMRLRVSIGLGCRRKSKFRVVYYVQRSRVSEQVPIVMGKIVESTDRSIFLRIYFYSLSR